MYFVGPRMLFAMRRDAAGSIQRTEERNYHYGTTPQALIALRLIYANRAMFDITGREYYVSDFLSPERHGQETQNDYSEA